MQIWQELVKFSLIGTERQTSPFVAEGELQPYISQLYPNNTIPPDASREQAFLSSAALVAQYRLAGQQPENYDGVLPEPDTSEALPSCCDDLTAMVRMLEERESLISRTFNKILYVLTFRRDMAVALTQ